MPDFGRFGGTRRAAVLGLASAAAALVVLAVNGPVVQANLSVTELPQTVSAHSSWAESLRGLGYWLTYFGGGGTTRPHPSPFVINQFAAALSLLLPLVALITLVRTKWRPARTFGWLLVLAMVAMVGLYPVDGDYPVGKAMSWLFDNVATTRSLRNGYKAGAGWALAIAVLVGIGVSDAGSSWLRRRAGRPGAARRSDNALQRPPPPERWCRRNRFGGRRALLERQPVSRGRDHRRSSPVLEDRRRLPERPAERRSGADPPRGQPHAVPLGLYRG